jgi:hypothetical protein
MKTERIGRRNPTPTRSRSESLRTTPRATGASGLPRVA